MSTSTQLYQQYLEQIQKIADLRYASAVLQWDQETYLPPKGAAYRGQQIATLSETAHDWFVQDAFGQLLQELSAADQLDPDQKMNVTRTLEDYERQKKCPSAFVRKLSEATNQSFHSWIKARKENDFSVFKADLDTLVALKKEEAAMLGYADHPYDALLDDHDKGSTVAQLDPLFRALRIPLKNLLDKIKAATPIDNSILKQYFPSARQWDLGLQVIKHMGYDMEAGRQDLAEHPFSINFNNKDVRVTTRIDENDLGNMLWSCIHEAGHALYEQGLPDGQYGLPLGEPASYTIHESQSRLWENHVGRSEGFIHHYFPLFKEYFPEQFSHTDADGLYRAINKVEPSLIRTEADELTYHFHVMIRYEIEKSLLDGTISAADVPALWNEQYEKFLGITVPDDKMGCLQDVHWSHGSFGYFPTYSLGSLYACQFFHYAKKDLPQFEADIARGDFAPLLNWLRKKVHAEGRRYTSGELCRKIGGESLQPDYFLDYLLVKYSKIYHF